MKSSVVLSLLFVVLVNELPAVLCSATLSIHMISFNNPTGRRMDKKCCDPLCIGACDHMFTICIDEPGGSHDIDDCKYKKYQTGEYKNQDTIWFAGGDMNGIPNPFGTTMNKWPGIVTVKIEVWDDDTSHSGHDIVDTYNFDLMLSDPFSGAATAHNIIPPLEKGQRWADEHQKTTLRYRWTVFCNPNYFGKDCSLHCEAQDSDEKGHYTCDPTTGDKICLPGYEDPDTSCKNIEDDCDGVTCMYGGTCVDEYRKYVCHCAAGYTGLNCETEINECESMPCTNGGTCIDKVNGTECVCKPDRLGSVCQFHICEQVAYCQNGGSCVINTNGDTDCICPKGFLGAKCETDFCQVSPCQHRGTCSGGECKCQPGYIGSRCEINRCDLIACNNGGTCKQGVCTCAAGYTGRYCEKDVNDCLQPGGGNKCKNQGTCIDQVGYFTCKCLPNFDGDICQRNITPSWETEPVPSEPPAPATTTKKGNLTPDPRNSAGPPQATERRTGDEPGAASNTSGSGLELWMIIVIVVVILLLLAIIIITLLALKYRKKSKENKQNMMTNPAFMPQDLDSLTMARNAAIQQQQTVNQQAAAIQQAAAVQLAAAQLQAAYAQQNGQVQFGRQNSGPQYSRQNSTSSTAALLPRGSLGSPGIAAAGFTPAFDNHLNNKLNNLETASSIAASTRTAGGGNLYDDPDRLSRKGKMPPPPPPQRDIDLEIAAAAKASAIENDN